MQSCVLVVEVESSEARHMIGSKDGRSWDFWVQRVWAGGTGAHAEPMEFRLPDKHPPYRPGLYLLGGGAVRTGYKGGIMVQTDVPLIPLDDAITELHRVRDLNNPSSGVGAAVGAVTPGPRRAA